MKSRGLAIWAVLGLTICMARPAMAAQLSPMLVSWLGAQTNIQSWSADFVQTRNLKSLMQPLTATGHVWYAAPNRFRWELGSPARTIAVRAPEEMLIIYPKLKRVERYPVTTDQAGPWRDALNLLEAGFPRSAAELESQFKILSEKTMNGSCELALQPVSSSARRMLPEITVEFSVRDFSLRVTELRFVDGSTMRNDFTNAVLNPQITADLFSPTIPQDYKVVEPLKSQ